MIRLPDVSPARLAKPAPVSRYELDAEWGGPAGLGREAMLRGLALRRGWDLVDNDLAEHRFAAWTHEEDARFDEEVAALLPAEAKGFAERNAGDFFERAKAFKASLPEGARPAIDSRLADYERKHFTKAAAAEDRAQLRAVRENLDAGLQATAIPAASVAGALAAGDPDKLDRLTSIKAERHGLIDRNPALSPFAKKQRKAAEEKAIDTAFAEALPPEEKRDLDPDAAIETVGARIRRFEEERRDGEFAAAGKDDPGAPDQAPATPDGFGREAWLNLIRRHRPELADGKTIQQVLALRADPELSAEMRERGLAVSARFLTDRGHAATPGRLYLAHVTSPETALLLLESDPDSPAMDVDPAAASARPDLFYAAGDESRPRAAGEVIALAEEAMTGTRPVDWRQLLSGASPEMQAALAADARDADARAATEAREAQEKAYRRRIEETEQAIEAGTFHYADLVKAAGEGGWVKGDDFRRLFNLLAKHSAETREYEAALSKSFDPEYQFDPTSPEDQRAVDLLYERGHFGGVGITKDDTAAQLTLAELLERTGIRPSQVATSAASPPGPERVDGPTESIVRETKSDRFIPEYHKKFADIRAAIADSGVPNGVRAVGELKHQLLRAGIGEVFGEDAVEIYDGIAAWADELAGGLRDEAHRYIEEHGEGLSALERANWKSLADGGAVAVSTILGSAGGAAWRGGGRRGGRGGKQANGGRDAQVWGEIDPKDWGSFPIIDIKTTRLQSSDAPKGTPEYEALNNPEPNTIYRLDNGRIFRTNEAGRVDRREFTPDPDNKRGRRKVDMGESVPKDHEIAHIEAAASGGSSDKSNLFFQHGNFNKGAYRVWEQRMRKLKAERVRVDFVRNDDPKSLKPDELHASYLIDGKWHKTIFKNGPGGK